MRISDEEYRAILSRPAMARANKAGGAPSRAVAEQVVRNEPVDKKKGKGSDAGRYAVSFVSRRRRLLDPDNICPKYFLDSLRYSGLLPDDRPEVIELAVSQEKAATKEEEGTFITIERIA
jgi:hypothetical protein